MQKSTRHKEGATYVKLETEAAPHGATQVQRDGGGLETIDPRYPLNSNLVCEPFLKKMALALRAGRVLTKASVRVLHLQLRSTEGRVKCLRSLTTLRN
jgi:hypothetical protein